jgi:SAM-dependent methyltransferase
MDAAEQHVSLELNYLYVLSTLARAPQLFNFAAGQRLRILDFGCGAGEVVVAGLEHGFDIFGADVYYAGSKAKEAAMRSPHWGSRILEITEQLPFENEHFDLVFANEVFEHVHDLPKVLADIWRVLKAGGVLLALFPSKEVLREGHIGIPLAHRFTKSSRLRSWYVLGLRAVGLGYFKGNLSARDWTKRQLAWLDEFTVYRPLKEIKRSFADAGFSLGYLESDYIQFRLRGRPLLAHVASWWPMTALGPTALRLLAGLVIVAKKDSGRSS